MALYPRGATVRGIQVFLVVCVAVLGMVSLTAAPQAPSYARESVAVGVDAAKAIVRSLSFKRLKRNVRTLAGFQTRYWSTEGNERARDWLHAELEGYGYAVERHRFIAAGRNGNETPKEIDSVYATKVGTVRAGQMYIASAHMDSTNFDSGDRSFAPGANDDASGTVLVLELARVFSHPDVVTDVSIRFAFWNAEEIGLVGSRAYVEDRLALQGVESPPGSSAFPEPEWLGVIQHDMMLYDHGMLVAATGLPADRQIPSADVDIEYDADLPFGGGALRLAAAWLSANATYATTRYPAEVGQFMQSTDSVSFSPHVASISVRENERRDEIGRGSDPHWHRSSDTFDTYRNEDFRLGFTALQMSAGALSELVVARLLEGALP